MNNLCKRYFFKEKESCKNTMCLEMREWSSVWLDREQQGDTERQIEVSKGRVFMSCQVIWAFPCR